MNAYLDDVNPRRRRRPKQIEVTTEIVVVYHVMRCPVCDSTRTRVYDSNHLPVRYHLCHCCGARFKSVEKL